MASGNQAHVHVLVGSPALCQEVESAWCQVVGRQLDAGVDASRDDRLLDRNDVDSHEDLYAPESPKSRDSSRVLLG